MALTKVTSGVRDLGTGEVVATDLASTLDLSSKTLTIPASAVTAAMVTAHVTATDLTPVRNDIATLALHTAISDNKAAYNLSNAFIDQYEDDTGIHVETTCDRNVAEYMSSVGTATDTNTKLLFAMDSSDTSAPISDKMGTTATFRIPGSSSCTYSSTGGVFSGIGYFRAGAADSNNGLELTRNGTIAGIDFGTGAFCLEGWVRNNAESDPAGHNYVFDLATAADTNRVSVGKHQSGGGSDYMGSFNGFGTTTNQLEALIIPTTWRHFAHCRDGSSNTAFFINGNRLYSGSSVTTDYDLSASGYMFILMRHDGATDSSNCDISQFRMSNIARYDPTQTTYTIPTAAWDGTKPSTNATGNYTSTTQASTASVSTMGIVVLYKNNAGTASLNTDIVAEVSANGGTNYANATLVAGGTFSTGINIAAVSGVAVTAGTTPKYRISFANQASGSKETQVYGVALLY